MMLGLCSVRVLGGLVFGGIFSIMWATLPLYVFVCVSCVYVCE